MWTDSGFGVFFKAYGVEYQVFLTSTNTTIFWSRRGFWVPPVDTTLTKGGLALRFSLGVLGWVDSGPFSNPDMRSESILDFDLGTWLVSALLVGSRTNQVGFSCPSSW